jgi:hypothetical protein
LFVPIYARLVESEDLVSSPEFLARIVEHLNVLLSHRQGYDLQNRGEVIRYAAANKAKAVSLRATIQFIRKNKSMYRDVDDAKLNEYESKLNELLDRIHTRISSCFNDYRSCAFGRDDLIIADEIRLPQPISGSDTPTSVLRMRSEGQDIIKLQQILLSKGFDLGAVDGRFGPKTNDAVRPFQAQN